MVNLQYLLCSMKNYRIIIICVLLVVCLRAYPQNETIKYFTRFNAICSTGDYAPFWLTANRQGLSSVDKNSGYARLGATVSKPFKNSDYRWAAAVDIVTGYNQESAVRVQQLYADVSWRWLNLSVGKKERAGELSGRSVIAGLDDNSVARSLPQTQMSNLQELGTGGLAYSGNSTPVPQVRLEVPHYVSVPRTAGWLKVKGHLAYGFFADGNFQEDFTQGNVYTRYAKNVLYHSKALFVKIGKPQKFPLSFEGGLEMYSQFGGDIYMHGKGKIVSMPKGPLEYLKAFVPLSGGGDTPDTEQTNISGNQLGNWHMAITLHSKPADVTLYGQHYFEDFSQLFFIEYQTNREGEKNLIYYPWKDILLGINVKNKSSLLPFVSNVCYEYLSTYNQSGAGYNDPGPIFKEQMDGLDNYYNHGIYSGWHNYGMGIGNPLVFSPVYNKNGSMYFAGNRLVAHNVGVNGAFGSKTMLAYRLLCTYSENWGTYLNPFNEKKYTTSLLADISLLREKGGWAVTFSVAYDKSNWLGENVGVMLSISKVGIFKL